MKTMVARQLFDNLRMEKSLPGLIHDPRPDEGGLRDRRRADALDAFDLAGWRRG
jgi:hypothetical protein